MEILMLQNLQDIMIKNDIGDPFQYGFVSGGCCEFQLIDLFHNICQELNDKLVSSVVMVFFDFEDALNKVPHILILQH